MVQIALVFARINTFEKSTNFLRPFPNRLLEMKKKTSAHLARRVYNFDCTPGSPLEIQHKSDRIEFAYVCVYEFKHSFHEEFAILRVVPYNLREASLENAYSRIIAMLAISCAPLELLVIKSDSKTLIYVF